MDCAAFWCCSIIVLSATPDFAAAFIHSKFHYRNFRPIHIEQRSVRGREGAAHEKILPVFLIRFEKSFMSENDGEVTMPK